MRCRLRVLSTAVLCALATSAAADESAPVDVVNRLHTSILGVLREAEDLGYQGRLERLTPALVAAFDLDFMARAAVGRHWKKLAEEDQKRWLDAFESLTCANYAGRFNRYSGQTFETLGDEPGAHETVVVRTRLVNPTDEDVDLIYRLHETDESWKIIDVYLKGTVSELALRRSEYSSVLRREGFTALIDAVNRRIADLAAGTAGD